MILEDVANTPEAWSARAAVPEPWAACGWSQHGQSARIAKALDLLRPRQGESLLDYGCGTGALAGALAPYDEFGADGIKYLGYDFAAGMVERARRDHPSRTFTDDIQRIAFRRFALIACVGTFNLAGDRLDTWMTLMSLWDQTDRALVALLYAGADERCIQYSADEIADFADTMAGRWHVERWAANDIAMVLSR